MTEARPNGPQTNGGDGADRRQWLGVLAAADPAALEAQWAGLDDPPAFTPLRPAEVGLVMVRGRMGGTGRPFNLGEMTVTRCSVRSAAGTVGHGYVAGRGRRHAELAAMFDALLQDPARRPDLLRDVIAPLAETAARRKRDKAARIAQSRVEFFTMVRGEDER